MSLKFILLFYFNDLSRKSAWPTRNQNFPTGNQNFPTDGHLDVVWGGRPPPLPPYSYASVTIRHWHTPFFPRQTHLISTFVFVKFRISQEFFFWQRVWLEDGERFSVPESSHNTGQVLVFVYTDKWIVIRCRICTVDPVPS